MIDIVLCIASSASLIILFKAIEPYKLNLLPVITFNYLTAVLCSMLVSHQLPSWHTLATANWLPFGLLLGILFITVFVWIGRSTQVSGITITAIAQKMSLVIPISAAIFLYSDAVNLYKIMGIVLALTAIVLSTNKPKVKAKADAPMVPKRLMLPAMVFFGSGIIDAIINYVQRNYLVGVPYGEFLVVLFGTAGISGALLLTVKALSGGKGFTLREVMAGLLIGIPNYFSMYFLLRALEFSGWQSSVVYPVLNIGVVTVATTTAWLVFKEKLTLVNLVGILLAIVAIIVLSRA
jgi:drug/metabolite transporter (DMT)-like permease